MTLRVALISGPMYQRVYDRIANFSRDRGVPVEIAFQGDHPALNEHLANFIERPGDLPYDLVSTHTKYFPSQLTLLAPLDDLLPDDSFTDFAPLLLDMVRLDGRTYCLPRNIDVRLLHYRTDLIEALPPTWDVLLETIRQVNAPPRYCGFVYPGMESGLFGTFYELAEMGGAHLFPPGLIPEIENEGGRWALNFLRVCYQDGLVPPEIPGWHYDKVHNCFRDGHAALVGDWPGYYSDYCDSTVSSVWDRFTVARYPVGPAGRSFVYGGGHTFALTIKGAGSADAAALIQFLTAPEQQIFEARQGSVPVRQSVMRQIKQETANEPAAHARWSTLERVIAEDILIPPKFASYPLIEEILWHTVQAALTGKMSIDEALSNITRQIREVIQ